MCLLLWAISHLRHTSDCDSEALKACFPYAEYFEGNYASSQWLFGATLNYSDNIFTCWAWTAGAVPCSVAVRLCVGSFGPSAFGNVRECVSSQRGGFRWWRDSWRCIMKADGRGSSSTVFAFSTALQFSLLKEISLSQNVPWPSPFQNTFVSALIFENNGFKYRKVKWKIQEMYLMYNRWITNI